MNDLTRLAEAVHQTLVSNNDPIYYFRPLPCELDNEVTRLIDTFIQADSSGRALILSGIRDKHSGWLFAYGQRMAELAVREDSRERLFYGLLALIIEGFKSDYRDNMVIWAPLYHSATKIGIDPAALFSEAASYANNTVSEWILDFPKRSPENRSLKAMGFREASAPDGFRYERLP